MGGDPGEACSQQLSRKCDGPSPDPREDAAAKSRVAISPPNKPLNLTKPRGLHL
jgi:hypothetical protein